MRRKEKREMMLGKPFVEIGFHRSGAMQNELDWSFSPSTVRELSDKDYKLLRQYLKELPSAVAEARKAKGK